MADPLLFLEFDDVLVETRAAKQAALRTALQADDIALPDDMDETFDAICGGLSFDAAARALYRLYRVPVDDTAVALAALRAQRDFALRATRGLPLAPGVRDFVLRAAPRARLGVVTRTARHDVDLLLEMAGLTDAFECCVTVEDYTGPEPASAPYDEAVVRMARRRPVTLGDGIALIASLHSVAAVRAARLHSLVVGAVAPPLAFAGEGYVPTLERVDVDDLVRLAAGANTR